MRIKTSQFKHTVKEVNDTCEAALFVAREFNINFLMLDRPQMSIGKVNR
jgi:hypothetical protein